MFLKDLTGRRFGKWTVIRQDGRTTHKLVRWLCRCDCGTERAVTGTRLRVGLTKSCGCAPSKPWKRHGLRNIPEYAIWCQMRQRCNNPNNKRWPDYGGRGIKVCDRWQVFSNFIADMGMRPPNKASLDRYPNPNGNYEPGNCRWATWTEQASTRRPKRQKGK